MKVTQTKRGFQVATFKDANGYTCSIQKSSAAEKDHIWLGAESDPEGRKVGVIGYLHHGEVIGGRMHLTRKQVRELLPLLNQFVLTGELKQ